MKGFINFDITVSKDGDGYRIKSKYDKGSETSDVLNKPPDENSAEIVELKDYLSGKVDELDDQIVKDAGAILHSWLFTPKVLFNFGQCRENARAQGMGVRLRLIFEDESLRRLPWEYCYDAELFNDFVVLNRRSPMVRYINLTSIPDLLELDRAARLLLAYSVDPDDEEAVETAEEELALIRRELAGLERQKAVVIEVAGQVNLEQLHDRLLVFQPDMLHLVAASQTEGSPRLIMLDDDNRPRVFEGDQLMRLFRNTAKAVILSAPPSQDAGNDAGLALAEALVRAEVPGVIALHRKMPTQVAGRFAAQFYRYLALLNSLDLAVTEMRINVQLYDKIAWGIPAVFMRAPDGRLWQEGVPDAGGGQPGMAPPGGPPSPFGGGYPPAYPQMQPQFDPYSPLMQLNFNNHVNGFVSFLSEVKIGGCLVRGHTADLDASGLNLLMKRLFDWINRQGNQPMKFEFPLKSNSTDNSGADLWNRLARWVDVSNFEQTQDKETVVKKLGQILTQKHVFFIFRDVESATFDSMLNHFWKPLVETLVDPNRSFLEPGRFRLLAFFLDKEGQVPSQTGEKIIEISVRDGKAIQPKDGWPENSVGAFFAIPAVNQFTETELEEWFSAPQMQPYLNYSGIDKQQAAKKIFEISNKGRPDLVLDELVKAQGLSDLYQLLKWLENW